MSAAKAAFVSWSKLSQDDRAEYLNRFADAIEANKSAFIELLGKEVGKPPQAGAFEMFLVMGLARDTPKMRLKEETVIDDAEVHIYRSTTSLGITNTDSFYSILPLCAVCLLVLVSGLYPGTSLSLSGLES